MKALALMHHEAARNAVRLLSIKQIDMRILEQLVAGCRNQFKLSNQVSSLQTLKRKCGQRYSKH